MRLLVHQLRLHSPLLTEPIYPIRCGPQFGKGNAEQNHKGESMNKQTSSVQNGTNRACASTPAEASEKRRIEMATVDAFVSLFNASQRQDYAILQYGDAPDARCQNGSGQTMQVEVTLTEDNPGDSAWSLGKHDKRPNRTPPGNCLQLNVLDQLLKRVDAKILKRYGTGTALVIRDSSGVDWDWEYVADEIRSALKQRPNPYDMGIWILNRAKSRLFRLT